MDIQYYRKNVYGQEKMYLSSPLEAAKAILLLTGKVTIDGEDIENLTTLGMKFHEVLAPK